MSLISKSKKQGLVTVNELQKRWGDAVKGDAKLAVASKDDYDKLLAAVNEATTNGESRSALYVRVKGLGASVIQLAKTLGVIA